MKLNNKNIFKLGAFVIAECDKSQDDHYHIFDQKGVEVAQCSNLDDAEMVCYALSITASMALWHPDLLHKIKGEHFDSLELVTLDPRSFGKVDHDK